MFPATEQSNQRLIWNWWDFTVRFSIAVFCCQNQEEFLQKTIIFITSITLQKRNLEILWEDLFSLIEGSNSGKAYALVALVPVIGWGCAYFGLKADKANFKKKIQVIEMFEKYLYTHRNMRWCTFNKTIGLMSMFPVLFQSVFNFPTTLQHVRYTIRSSKLSIISLNRHILRRM